MTKILAHFLAPGGMLLVVDFAAEKDLLRDVDHSHGVSHEDGMSEEVIRTAFEGAGLGEFKMRNVEKTTMHKEVTIFLASGLKA